MRIPILLILALGACRGDQTQIVWTSDTDPSAEDAGSQVVLVVPNHDDDDRNGVPDWQQRGAENDDDFATLTLRNRARDTLVTLEGDQDLVRVWYEDEIVLGEGGAESWLLPERHRRDTIEVRVEVNGWGPLGLLRLQDMKREWSTEVAIVGSEPTLAHHLLPSERIWVMPARLPGRNNDAMVADLKDGLGSMLHEVDALTFDFDVWVQDEPEFTRAWSPDSEQTLIINSIRNGQGQGGLMTFPPSLVEPDVHEDTWGQPRDATTFDAFGNLEASPPVEVDGVNYPMGRIYYGWDGVNEGVGPVREIRDHLDSIQSQRPFWVDTDWLCVAHIDEVVSFVPDPTAPRGFRFLVSDIELGYQAITSVPAETALTNHGLSSVTGAGHGRPTAGSYANDTALRAYNQDLQRDHLEPIIETFRRELALVDEEIVRVPAYFEEFVDRGFVCGAAAVIPGMVNLLMETDENGQGGRAWIADPFFRPPGAEQSADPFIQMWDDLLPATVTPVYIDNWDLYHMGLGEVHCGTNQERTPALAVIDDLNDWLLEVAQ
ncbi:MAG: hypothetical protein EA397_17555 [Deltaproteobacteria bacterium]|nr:MAG: hypothetical protein EA397_17555 [Deltaproteobacteria bacterium]